MTKSRIKIVAIMLVAVLVLAILSGCGDNQAIGQSGMAGQSLSNGGVFRLGDNSGGIQQTDSGQNATAYAFATSSPTLTQRSTSTPVNNNNSGGVSTASTGYDDYDIGNGFDNQYDYEFKRYATPTYAYGNKIYEAIDAQPSWVSIGFADNPNQISGTEGDFDEDVLEGCELSVTFKANNEVKIYESYPDSEYDEYDALYEIMDTEYLDTYAGEDMRSNLRFYYSDSDLMYMCRIGGEEVDWADTSDFIVFAPAS